MQYFINAVKPISTVMAIIFLLVSASYQPATAAMVGTEKFMKADNGPSSRDELSDMLTREEIRDALVARGIDPLEAQLRIQALTDDEIRLIADKIDELAAGGGVGTFALIIIGVIVATVLLFKYTKISNVFP